VDLTSVVTGVLGYHGGMIADRVRTDAFRRAIAEVVRPGDVVIDLGAGTGILALFACQAGAARVYAIEAAQVIHYARELIAANRAEDRICLVEGSSYDVTLPEPADVLLSETLWHFGLGEGIVGAIDDARRRLLAPDARIIPRSITLVAAPIESDAAYAPLERWAAAGKYDVDLSVLRAHETNATHQVDAHESELLAAPKTLVTLDLARGANAELDAEVAFEAARDGVLHGLAGWFRAQLSSSVDLTNGPPRRTTSWTHVLFPMEQPVRVRAGEALTWRLQTTANGTAWRWRTNVRAQSAGLRSVASDQSTIWAAPSPGSASARRSAGFRPTLSAEGRIEAFILRQFDGRRTVSEVEAMAKGEFPTSDRIGDRVRALASRLSE